MMVSRASPEFADGLGELALILVERRVEQQAGHADDGIHRRADLVAHRRQKSALGLCGRFRLGLGLAQLVEQPHILHRDRGLACQAAQEIQVHGRELPLHRPAVQCQHTDRLLAHDQRRHHHRFGLCLAFRRACHVHAPRVPTGVSDDLRLTAEDDGARDALPGPDALGPELLGIVAQRHLGAIGLPVWLHKPQNGRAGPAHLMRAPGNVFHNGRELVRRRDLPPGLRQRLHLPGPLFGFLEQAHILQGHAHAGGQRRHQSHVRIAEGVLALVVAHLEHADDFAACDDRHVSTMTSPRRCPVLKPHHVLQTTRRSPR